MLTNEEKKKPADKREKRKNVLTDKEKERKNLLTKRGEKETQDHTDRTRLTKRGRRKPPTDEERRTY